MDCVVYLRVSTTKQELQNQLDQIRIYCRAKNYTIIQIFQDKTSGYNDKRPEFDNMLKKARLRSFYHLIFWSLDRFSRSGTLFTMQLLNEFDNLGITYESLTEPYLTTIGEMRDIFIAIKSTFAKIEKSLISERTKAGLETAKKKGKKLGRQKGSKDKKKRKRSGYFERWEKQQEKSKNET